MPELSHTIVFRAVAGAVKNTLHGHPNWDVPTDFARSVAKRAAGTLAGMNPGVALAAARQSGKRGTFYHLEAPLRARAFLVTEARALPAFKRAIERRITDAHRAGDAERFLELCTVARIIKREMAREKDAPPLKDGQG